ncbi:hypothetical protein BDW60DRAFT_50072 [Aspergillus nidulans var. acristatus]
MPRKTVLITGCSDDGIGSGLALTFQAQNYDVFATARNPAKMSRLSDLPNVTLLPLDVCKNDEITAAVEAVKSHTGDTGKLDYLINNAGYGHFMPILDQDLKKARDLYESNVWGPLAVTQAFAPLLINAHGTVTFITSVSGYINCPYIGVYAASKRSLEIIAETLRLELQPFGVRVLSVVTGAVQSMGQVGRFDEYELPEDSMYKPIEAVIKDRAQGKDGIDREELMTYCSKVVSEITDGRAKKFWCGGSAGFARFVTSCMPGVYLDHIVSKGTGLDVLATEKKDN